MVFFTITRAKEFYNYLNKYLGSIPSINRSESWVDVGKEFPTGNVNEIWKKLDMKLILIDQVEVTNRINLRSTIKVYDAP